MVTSWPLYRGHLSLRPFVFNDLYGGHSRIRTYDFHRVKVWRNLPVEHSKGVINRQSGQKPAIWALFATRMQQRILRCGQGLTVEGQPVLLPPIFPSASVTSVRRQGQYSRVRACSPAI